MNRAKKIEITILLVLTNIYNVSAQMKSYTEVIANAGTHYRINTYLAAMNIGVERDIYRRLVFGAEFNFYNFLDLDQSAFGIGIRPTLKYYYKRTRTVSYFTAIKGGVIYMSAAYPKYASRFNFTFSFVTGIEYKLSKNNSFYFGGIYDHLSNGNIYGYDNNLTWDGLGFVSGITFRLYPNK